MLDNRPSLAKVEEGDSLLSLHGQQKFEVPAEQRSNPYPFALVAGAVALVLCSSLYTFGSTKPNVSLLSVPSIATVTFGKPLTPKKGEPLLGPSSQHALPPQAVLTSGGRPQIRKSFKNAVPEANVDLYVEQAMAHMLPESSIQGATIAWPSSPAWTLMGFAMAGMALLAMLGYRKSTHSQTRMATMSIQADSAMAMEVLQKVMNGTIYNIGEKWQFGKFMFWTTAIVRSLKGVPVVEFREFYETKEGAVMPGSKGIPLQKETWKALLAVTKELDEEFDKLDEAQEDRALDSNKPFHELGGKTRASAEFFEGKPMVDIREFYGPVVPGHVGIELQGPRWKAFLAIAEELDAEFDKIDKA